MKAALRMLSLAFALVAGAAFGDEDQSARDGYSIRSLNLPDPIFITVGDSVQIRVSSDSPAAIRRAGIRLNGDDVTSAFSVTEPSVMTATVAGLQPGINTFEVFKTKRE